VDGERWQVRADESLRVGQQVRITRIDGLTLEVRSTHEGVSP
jgi:membrane protein implicated in regulation of membrane protease activity